MLNPLQINSGPSGQKNETGMGESNKEALMKGYSLNKNYFIIIDHMKIEKVGSCEGDLNLAKAR
jgi:hypothetical protein